jgi:nucleoside 2-deoxyribosyltransferase
MKIFIIGAVRGASEEWKERLNRHVSELESSGATVHLPHRDTNQSASGLDICRQNCAAIAAADEVHLFYRGDSQGTHFDMGCAFALGKRLRVVESEKYGEGKSYPRMAREWELANANNEAHDSSAMKDEAGQ